MQWLASVFGALFVTPNAPIDVAPEDNPTNEPGPDLAVLEHPCLAYETANPGPSDVRLLVEISDTTLAFDLGTKSRLYARAGIHEYWVVDVQGQRILVHRNPRAGVYENVTYPAGASEWMMRSRPKAVPPRHRRHRGAGDLVACLASVNTLAEIGSVFAVTRRKPCRPTCTAKAIYAIFVVCDLPTVILLTALPAVARYCPSFCATGYCKVRAARMCVKLITSRPLLHNTWYRGKSSVNTRTSWPTLKIAASVKPNVR